MNRGGENVSTDFVRRKLHHAQNQFQGATELNVKIKLQHSMVCFETETHQLVFD